MKKIFLTLLSVSLFSVANLSLAKTIATVNGVKITEKRVMELENQIKAQSGRTIPRNQIIDSLIKEEVLKQKAYKSGLGENKAIKKQLKLIKDKLVVEEYIKKLMAKIKISDKEYKKAYKTFVANNKGMQYKASHILVKTEKEAKNLIKKVNKNNFAKFAKEKSIGPSGKNGGDLGWFSTKTMVKAFGDAVNKMKKGSISKKPVKTRFGYHVIYLQDKKKAKVPTLEELKPSLRNQLLQPKLIKKIEEMVKKSKVKMK